MSIDVATDLLGEIVEIYEYSHGYGNERSGYSLRARGHVRSVYVADRQLHVLVEHNLGYESASHNDRTKDGGFETYALHEKRARVVQRCARCFTWDQKILLFQAVEAGAERAEHVWEHKSGEGCKKVGHDG